MKKWICKGLLLIAMLVLLAGCAGQAAAAPKAGEKERVVVACWGNQMLDSYTLLGQPDARQLHPVSVRPVPAGGV